MDIHKGQDTDQATSLDISPDTHQPTTSHPSHHDMFLAPHQSQILMPVVQWAVSQRRRATVVICASPQTCPRQGRVKRVKKANERVGSRESSADLDIFFFTPLFIFFLRLRFSPADVIFFACLVQYAACGRVMLTSYDLIRSLLYIVIGYRHLGVGLIFN